MVIVHLSIYFYFFISCCGSVDDMTLFSGIFNDRMSRTGIATMMDTKVKRKKGEDADEAARLEEELKSYEESFGLSNQDGTLKGKAFIRMDIVNANKSVGETKPSLYKPALPNPLATKKTPSQAAKNTFEEAKRQAAEKARKMLEDAHKGKPGPAPTVIVPTTAPPVNRPPKPGTSRAKEIQKSKTSNLDAFKEELKRLQAERDNRKNVREHLKNDLGVDQAQIDILAPPIENPYVNVGSGSAELDDNSITTNLYIGNLPLTVTMQDLLDTFGTFGPLASGKILYPRPEEERKREYLCGFIAYMHRKDFDRAMVQLQGLVIRGETVKISYARQVNIPPVPFYVPSVMEKLSFPDPPTGLPFNATPRSSDLREYLEKWKNLPKLGGTVPENEEELADYKKMIKNATVRVVIPTDSNLLAIIHRVIEFIVREGPLFEAMLMSRESTNTLFRFLFDNHHPAHVYYRWRLYSVLQGERPVIWRRERFRLFDEGSWWQPPIPPHELHKQMPESLYYTAFNVSDQRAKMGLVEVKERRRSHMDEREGSSEDKIKRKKAYLSSKDRDKLEDMIRELTPEKEVIGMSMVWCLEHAMWSGEISECLYESMTIDETPLHKKIARLYLISDILANAAVRGVKDVFYYRQHLETLFPKIFAALGKSLRSIEGRLKAEQFKQRVMNCFRAWEDSQLYPNEQLIHCQNIFLGLVQEDTTDVSDGDDIDGAPLEEDIDGMPVDSFPTAIATNWNTVEEDEDMDGVPLDEVPKAVTPSRKAAFKPMQWSNVNDAPNAKRSKWDEDADGEEEKKIIRAPSPLKTDNQSTVPEGDSDEEIERDTKKNTTNIVMDDETRRLMREIEVKMMALQDELEADGEQDVKKKMEKYREELMRKMEEKLGKDKKKDKKEKKEKKKEKKEERTRSRSREKEKERERERRRSRSRSRERRRERRERSRSRDRERDSRRDRDRRSRSRDRRR